MTSNSSGSKNTVLQWLQAWNPVSQRAHGLSQPAGALEAVESQIPVCITNRTGDVLAPEAHYSGRPDQILRGIPEVPNRRPISRSAKVQPSLSNTSRVESRVFTTNDPS